MMKFSQKASNSVINSKASKNKKESLSQEEYDVFGKDLKILEDLCYSKEVPEIISIFGYFIKVYGLLLQGLFRVSGNRTRMDEIHQNYTKKRVVEIGSDDIHNVTGLFKLFLRDLPDGLIPYSYAMDLLKAFKVYKNTEKLELITSELLKLPVPHYNLLKYTCNLLYSITQYSSSNLMTAENLGTVFGPTIFTSIEDMSYLPIENLTTALLIQNYSNLFKVSAPVHTNLSQTSSDQINYDSLSSVHSSINGNSLTKLSNEHNTVVKFGESLLVINMSPEELQLSSSYQDEESVPVGFSFSDSMDLSYINNNGTNNHHQHHQSRSIQMSTPLSMALKMCVSNHINPAGSVPIQPQQQLLHNNYYNDNSMPNYHSNNNNNSLQAYNNQIAQQFLQQQQGYNNSYNCYNYLQQPYQQQQQQQMYYPQPNQYLISDLMLKPDLQYQSLQHHLQNQNFTMNGFYNNNTQINNNFNQSISRKKHPQTESVSSAHTRESSIDNGNLSSAPVVPPRTSKATSKQPVPQLDLSALISNDNNNNNNHHQSHNHTPTQSDNVTSQSRQVNIKPVPNKQQLQRHQLQQHYNNNQPINDSAEPVYYDQPESLNITPINIKPVPNKRRNSLGTVNHNNTDTTMPNLNNELSNMSIGPNTDSGAIHKRISMLKKQLRSFDEQYMENNGYKPDKFEKMQNIWFKETVSELNQLREQKEQLRNNAVLELDESSSLETGPVLPTNTTTTESNATANSSSNTMVNCVDNGSYGHRRLSYQHQQQQSQQASNNSKTNSKNNLRKQSLNIKNTSSYVAGSYVVPGAYGDTTQPWNNNTSTTANYSQSQRPCSAMSESIIANKSNFNGSTQSPLATPSSGKYANILNSGATNNTKNQQQQQQPVSSNDADIDQIDLDQMKRTLDNISSHLNDERRKDNRPEDLTLMSPYQIEVEKVTMQKALLDFESKFGRRRSPQVLQMMKPLYDRYRQVKKLLANTVDQFETMNLPTTAGNQAPYRRPASTTGASSSSAWVRSETQLVVKVPTQSSLAPAAEASTNEEFIELINDDLEHTQQQHMQNQQRLNPSAQRRRNYNNNNNNNNPGNSTRGLIHLRRNSTLDNNNIASPSAESDALIEIQRLLIDKKNLQKLLKDFENNFERESQRKVDKTDRLPMDREYMRYKQIKTRIRELEDILNSTNDNVRITSNINNTIN